MSHIADLSDTTVIGDIATLLWILVSIIVILGLAYWVTRRMAGSSSFSWFKVRGSDQQFKVLARLALGKGQMLVVVQTGKRYFLLGVTDGGISTLAEFTKEEAEVWKEQPGDPEGGEKTSFREALHTILRQKGRR